MEREEDTTIDSADQAYYELPNWFLERYVRTAQDLTKTPDQVVFCNCDDCKETKLHDNSCNGEGQPGDKLDIVQAKNESGHAPDKMHYNTFAELRDLTCASFMPLQDGKLKGDSTIVFRMEEESTRTPILEPAWMSRVVVQLAKASKAMSLIYFDFETLEELGSEFHNQDKQRAGKDNSSTADWEPDMDSLTTFLKHFFAIASKAHADRESWKRRHNSLSTVLNAATAAKCARMQRRDGSDAVLVHIMDCPLVNEALGHRLEVKRRVLKRFAEIVRARREQGQSVTILLSTKDSSYKGLGTIGRTETFTVTASSDKILDSDRRNRVRTGIINTQRMRRLMRRQLPSNLFCNELLTFSTDWASENRLTYESFGEALWSSGDLKKAITLLMGRGWRISKSSSHMIFTDIRVVLECLGLFHSAEGEDVAQEASDAGNDSNDEPSAWPSVVSQAGQQWTQQKKRQKGQHNAALDSLMGLIGLEEAKSQFMAIKNRVETSRRQVGIPANEGLGAVFMGGPGTGKSTVAALYAQFLSALGVVPKLRFRRTTGARLADRGRTEWLSIIKGFGITEFDEETTDYDEETTDYDEGTNSGRKKIRGVVFIDGAHEMVPSGADRTFNYLMDELQRLQGQVVFLFAGPPKEMQSFLGLSPSLRSHIPFTFRFEDFTDGEIHRILVKQLRSKFQGKMRVEGGINGVFMRVLTRRIGRGRGSGSFANALEVQNALSRVLLRQANRLSHSRKLQENADDMFLTQTDLIGPSPMSTLEESTAWKKLQDMTGLALVKQSVRTLITQLQTNYDRELVEEPLVESSLNKVFLGNPGTGKTTVAKYYAQILTELGLLSDGEVMVRSCHDFIGQYLGHSESQTKAILSSARGKVLIIDEAYGLSRDHKFAAAAVDTIVAEVQATSTEDRAVLLLGYKDEMEEMFRRVNPGLARRFPLSSAFEFQDFSDEELRSILEKKLQAQGFIASEQAKQVAMEVLSRCRNHQNFGNAGEIDILLDRAKASQQMRLDGSKGSSTPLITELKEVDFDADYDRRDRAESNIQEAFANLIGAEALVAQFQAYRRIAQNSKDLGLDPREQVPFNFIFRGPPGTGKTTTARKLGQIFFDMGFLATKEVEVCSASELIAEYIGQTGPKTQKVFQKALGKVLFIDEAYRLADGAYKGIHGGNFGKEAVDEIVNLVTLPKYKNRLVVVLAGYDQDINHLLTTNPGFGSRFSEVIEFPNLSPKHCQELFVRLLQDKKLGVGSLRLPSAVEKVQALFQTLSDLPDWGNARDVENLATSLFGKIISSPVSPPYLDVAIECVYDEMNEMITERRKRGEDAADFDQQTS